jgi:hypothetical protein
LVGNGDPLAGPLPDAVAHPEFATAIGLVKYGSIFRRRPMASPGWWAKLKAFIKKLMSLGW